jgi:hypothetical protein
MNTLRRSVILKLAAEAYEMKLNVANGVLTRTDDGGWRIGHQGLAEWLSGHDGEEVVLILGSLADDTPVLTRTCHTCGRDYTDLECPYCRASRLRLRGQP